MESFGGAYQQISAVEHRPKAELIKISLEDCCIYRVPLEQRLINPEAYTPRRVLIGPLTHSKKQEALDMEEEKSTTFEIENVKHRYKEYMSMERHKLTYYDSFRERIGEDEMSRLTSYIETKTDKIRRCYAESTTWINDNDLVNLILLDAIFIIEFFRRSLNSEDYPEDLVVGTGIRGIVLTDLYLLENQLPFFILKEISGTIFSKNFLEKLVICLYSDIIIDDETSNDIEFKHITDVIRYVRIRSLKMPADIPTISVDHIYNVEQLVESGVDFEVMEGEAANSINMRLDKKTLKMAPLFVDEHKEIALRNIIALEQCHYVDQEYVCSYVFLDFLIDSGKDVDILMRRGVIKNFTDNASMVANMVNKLCYGVGVSGSCYYDIAMRLNKHHDNFWNRTMAALRHNYFDNVWKGTATVAGVILLLLTLIQTITSILQVKQG